MGLFDDYLTTAVATPPGVPRITVTPGSVERPSIPPEGRQLLDTIAGSESPGYNVKYGGGTFNDFADHPRDAVPITTGPNAGRTSSAAGRYQFLGSTWDEVKKEAGLPDFSPDSQDAGAWYLANKIYQQRTGRDLTQDLQSAKGNPNAIKQIGGALSGVWTSLPGGQEPNRATASFASRYDGGMAPTEFSAQSRPPAAGIFGDYLAPQGQVAAPPASGSPPALAGGEPQQPAPRIAREGMSAPAPDVGRVNAFLSGIKSGATFNFGDELEGAYAAGQAGFGLPKGSHSTGQFTPLVGLARLGYEYLTGQHGEATRAYEATRDQAREDTKTAEAQYPGTTLAGNIVGGAAVPLGAASRGLTLGERATQGARVGAVVGGLSGVGAGEDAGGRALGGVIGAGTGGVIGAAAPAVIEGAVKAGRSASVPIANAIRGIRDPEGEAARRGTLAIARDIKADPQASTRLTPQEFAASIQSGGPAKIMDLGGETTRALARSASNTSTEGRQLLNNTINDRFEGQAGRVTKWLDDTFNYPNASAQKEAIEQVAKTVNNPAYARAMKDGAGGVWDAELQRLAGAPAVQQAAREAIPSLANRGITEGFKAPRQNPLSMAPDGRAVLTTTPNGNQIVPDLRFWDQVKKNIDAQISKAEKYGDNGKVQELTALNKEMIKNLDRVVPTYQQARAGAAHFFGAENALEAGQNFVMQNFQNSAVRQQIAKMTPSERQLFQDGFVSRFMETINKVGDRRSILNQIGDNPAAREKLSIVLGPQKAAQLEAGMRAEGVMDLARKAVQGNSTTARQLAELGLAGGTYGLGTGGDVLNPNPTAVMNAVLVYGAARGRTKINEGLSRKVAEMLTSNDPALLLKGIKIVGQNGALLTSMRRADGALARAGSQQSAGLPSVQSSVLTRAQEDEPTVPRPPGQ